MQTEKKIYAVVGASGNIGSKVSGFLLETGAEVRVIGRNAENLKALIGKGAKFFQANLENAAELTAAFKGADGAFVMIPPNNTAPDFRQYQNKTADVIVAAIQASGIKHVAALSSIGANNAQGVGLVNGLHDFETRLEKLGGVNIRVFRAAMFMENHYNFIGMIQGVGFAGTPAPGDVAFPMIATRDIARRVADALLKRDFQGYSVKYLLGQRDLTFNESVRIVGEAIGKKDLKYSQVPPQQAKSGMVQMGMSESVADGMNELMLAGKLLAPTEPRSAENTTPTTFEQFAKEEFAPRFEAAAASKAAR